MEQNIKQHTLTLEKGLTSIPSDLVCPDNTLSSADGFVYLDGEYKALQNPENTNLSNITNKLVFVHRLNDGVTTNYITASGSYLYWGENQTQISVGSTVLDVKSVGNTLIVNTEYGLRYYLWKYDNGQNSYRYFYLGNRIPEPNISFSTERCSIESTLYPKMDTSTVVYYVKPANNESYVWVKSGDADTFENLCVGAYSELKNKTHDKGFFLNPFFVRAAVELYDGSYTNIGNPVLIHTFFGENMQWLINALGESEYSSTNMAESITLKSLAVNLFASQYTDYSDYSDIVRGVTLFITTFVDRFATSHADVAWSVGGAGMTKQWDSLNKMGKSNFTYYFAHNDSQLVTYTEDQANTVYRFLPLRSDANIIADLKRQSVFYKLCDIGRKPISNKSVSSYISEKTINNISTQKILEHDDFFGHVNYKAGFIATFNRRLNAANVLRDFFGGFTHFGNISNGNSAVRSIYVRIKTYNGYKIVLAQDPNESYFPIENGYWFFYPDPRADHVWVKVNGECKLSADLVEHEGLNGSYYLSSMPNENKEITTPSTISETVVTSGPTYETLPNYLLQSEVDNPFTFFASGYVRVGQGTIIGMAGLTTALSQDAYKISTTLVFTTQGIWALKINDEGQYTSVAPPFSREVCSVSESITMTDNAVFFVSKKGLMCVTGASESSVVCVSSQLRDSALVSFLHAKDTNSNNLCRIAYDYKESLLYIYNIGSKEAYIYSISTGTWTHDTDCFDGNNDTFLTCVTDYPDTLVQTSDHVVYSFLNRDNRNVDTDKFNCSLETRPVKFDGSLILDSIRQIKHLVSPDIKICRTLAEYTPVTTAAMLLTVKGSNDLKTWTTISSLKGKPYKFFKFKYEFKNLTATSTFAGTSFIVQQRYTEKML